ncbi:hypothetical protein D187_008735 [Cystobacter fuscus DSM 2262]|uniref:Uncharacterized protein n=1 Tax=Cystobacter fuscus (strain ATCC 25194 / DSM 2262 / NBRC 100088 / M29) TaxID=1242864 RepID=S9PJF9_CYSF2|nr:hypothetical protein [Cystobacter fuscus]EPX62547.1 hypothetical protein D187_008735 [Cystobacter fuscus DSM 2262]
MKVTVDTAALRQLRDDAPQVLRALDHPLRDAARRILDISLFLVPRGGAPGDPLNLADTAFLDGPFFNPERKSSTWTCGYAHPAAGAIHQGFHWGDALKPPPDFLRRATKGISRQLKKAVGHVLMREIARLTQ